MVRWCLPEERWIKINSDGASKDNPRVSSYDFCYRYFKEDLIYAEANNIDNGSNLGAEMVAL